MWPSAVLSSNINQAMNELTKEERVKKARFRLMRNSYIYGKRGRKKAVETVQEESSELHETPEVTALWEEK